MDYAILKCNKSDYLIVDTDTWKRFKESLKTATKDMKKNHLFKLGRNEFTYKDAKKISNQFSGKFIDLYNLMPEIVIKEADYHLTNEAILERLSDMPNRKWEYLDFYSTIFTYDNFPFENYDYQYEAVNKYKFIKFFEKDDISKIGNTEYEMLVNIALRSRYDDNNPAIDNILSDSRFKLPEGFDVLYSNEMEFDEDIKYVHDKDIIKKFFTESKFGLNRFLSAKNTYNAEVTEVLKEINPVIYQVLPYITKDTFSNLYEYRIKNGLPVDEALYGSTDQTNSSNLLSMKIKKSSAALYKADFEDAYKDKETVDKCISEFDDNFELVKNGLDTCTEIFDAKTCKTILDSIVQLIRCETYKAKATDELNYFIDSLKNSAFEMHRTEIFNDCFNNNSLEYKMAIKLLSEDNFRFFNENTTLDLEDCR